MTSGRQHPENERHEQRQRREFAASKHFSRVTKAALIDNQITTGPLAS